MLVEKVSRILKHECYLDKDIPLIVGVSGGADSLCLLDLFIQSGYQPIIAHFNHGIRPEAKAEADFVDQFGRSKGMHVVLATGSVPEHARGNALSTEESARILRYGFLFEQAKIFHAQAVAVAHNADDQVETVLMHILRGTGLNGLAGMTFQNLPNPWSEDIPLVRPLLNIWRKEINVYCKENNLEPVFDRTNLDTHYLRNQIRHELIPLLNDLVPGFKGRLWQLSDLLKADQIVLADYTDQVWRTMVADQGRGFVSLNVNLLRRQSLGMQRLLIRRGVKEIAQNLTNIDYAFVDRIVNFTSKTSLSHEMDAGQGMKVLVEGDQLYIAYWNATLPTSQWPQICEERALAVPGEIHLGPRWILKVERYTDNETTRKAAIMNQDPNVAWLTLNEGISSLLVRRRRPGDRFQPLGMDGRSMKVSDYMINQKISRRARENWPLLCVGDEIAWIAGYRLAHPFRLREETGEVIKCSLNYIPFSES